MTRPICFICYITIITIDKVELSQDPRHYKIIANEGGCYRIPCTPLYPFKVFLLTILAQNFMLIKNHIETWVCKPTEMIDL